MASELLASHNETYWGERKIYMRKTPNTNLNRNFVPNPNPNPNPNPTQLKNHGHVPDRQHNRIQPKESDAVSDDSSSFKRKPFDLGRRRETGGYVTYNISTYTKNEVRDLKRRLVSELEQVRTITSRIESRDPQSLARCEMNSSSSSGPIERSTMTMTKKKTQQQLIPSCPLPCPEMEKLSSGMMNKCGQILNKLMKHKGAQWFNSPVDVVRLNLYDYCQIIKEPMDLGTAKTKLAKNLYSSPTEFADDVRLTFKNALIYNPEGHVVHKFAGQLLRLFESQFVPAHQKYEKQLSAISHHQQQQQQQQQEAAERQRALLSSRPLLLPMPMPEPPTRVIVPPSSPPPHLPVVEIQKIPPPPQKQQQQQQWQQQWQQKQAMVVLSKQAKPKAKDPNKRAMNMEEKKQLGLALADLPEAKAAHVLQIVQKRNVQTAQEGDEVVIDFELMDNETLWELDRLVCNWKKMMSKMRRQEAAAAAAAAMSSATTSCPLPLPHHPPPPSLAHAAAAVHKVADDERLEEEEETVAVSLMKKSKKMDPYDEDVDIGDELPVTNYPSVIIEKEDVAAATADDNDSSSSSRGGGGGSASSSSSDSESGSSSGTDSDDDQDINGADSTAAAAGGERPLPTGN